MNILRMRKIGADQWTEVENPMSLQWSLSDLDSEDGNGRNQMGETFKDRITQKRQLSCSWAAMEGAKMKTLLSCLNDNFFELEYPDALTGKREASVFYVSSKQTPMYRFDPKSDQWLWTGLSATLVER